MLESIRRKCRKDVKGKQEIFLWNKIQRNISLLFVSVLIRLGVSNPDFVTLFAFWLSLIASIVLATGNMLWAFLLFQLYFIFDCCNGDLARYYGRANYFGKFTDRLVHIVAEPLLFLSCGMACGNILYGIIPAFCCQNGLRLIEWNYRISEHEESTSQPLRHSSQNILENIARFLSIYGFTLLLLFNNVTLLRGALVFWSFWTPLSCIYLVRVLWRQKHE